MENNFITKEEFIKKNAKPKLLITFFSNLYIIVKKKGYLYY
jgi:hypothetical protein